MAKFDASHDMAHVRRVVLRALHIAREETRLRGHRYDLLVVELSALLHDVGDKKYLSVDEDGETMAKNFLLSIGAPDELATAVQKVASAVSYSGERADPDRVRTVLREHPELGPVQDADRLDALGAVGIARSFTYHALKLKDGLEGAVEHFGDKLVKLESLMKTDTGRHLARERTHRIAQFTDWFNEEAGTDIFANRNFLGESLVDAHSRNAVLPLEPLTRTKGL